MYCGNRAFFYLDEELIAFIAHSNLLLGEGGPRSGG